MEFFNKLKASYYLKKAFKLLDKQECLAADF